MKNTPETDSADYCIDGYDERVYVCIDFARNLEMQRDELLEACECAAQGKIGWVEAVEQAIAKAKGEAP